MKRIFMPPTFFLAGIVLVPASFWLSPALNVIKGPINLFGFIFIASGIYLVGTSHDQLKSHGTPYNFDRSIRIVRDGLYRYTRNPMYLGMIGILFGSALCFGNLAALIVPFLFFLIIHHIFIPFEERKLEREIGPEYLDYMKKVRRWF